MKPSKNFSIFRKLFLAQTITLLSVLITIVVMCFLFFKTFFYDYEKKYLEHLGKSFPHELSIQVETINNSFKQIMKDNHLKSYHKNFHDAVLIRFLNAHKDIFDILSYIDNNGFETFRIEQEKLFVSSSNMQNNELFQKVIKNPNEIFMSELHFDERLNANVLQFAVQRRTYFGDKFEGILLGTITLNRLLQEEHLYRDQELAYRIFNPAGNILFSNQKKDMIIKGNMNKEILKDVQKNLLTQPSDFRKVNVLGQETFTYFAHLLNDQIILAISYSYDDFLDMYYEIIKGVILVFIIIFVVSSLTLYRYSLHIVKPLQRLFSAMQEVAQGNLNCILPSSTKDSLFTITNSFNSMVEQLLQGRTKLEAESKKLTLLNNSLENQVQEQIETLRQKDKILFQQSKLAAMGEMIDAIAHQWRQPLSSILTFTSSFKMKLGYDIPISNEEILECNNAVSHQIEHLNKTIDDFRSFLRPDLKVEECVLHEIVQSCLVLMKDELIKNNIQIINHIDETIKAPMIKNEIIHVIINLINNSKDAFIEKGIENRVITFSAKEAFGNLYFAVVDNAGGIPKNILHHVFEANFTTKESTKGTGIGLYMSKQIIEKINGTISVQPITLEDNQLGSEFLIAFPLRFGNK